MDICQLSNVTADTLAEFLSINMPPDMLASVEQQLASGELKHEQMYIFGCDGSPEAAFTLTPAPIVVPRIKSDITEPHLSHFAQMLGEMLKDEEKIVIIDNNLAEINIAAFTEAGWNIQGHDKMYETDLTRGEWKLDSEVVELGANELLSSEMLNFYEKILETDDTIGDTGSRDPTEAFEDDATDEDIQLFVLKDHQAIVAAATLFPMGSDRIGIQVLGVLPSARGQGAGSRLHAHLLATAKQKGAERHVGGTSAENIAMHTIYAKNGAALLSEQYQLMM